MTKPIIRAIGLVLIFTSVSKGQAYEAYLSGGSQVPAVLSLGVGTATATLSGSSLTVTGNFDDLEGTFVSATIESGYAGRSGGVQFSLTTSVDGDGLGGTFAGGVNVFSLSGAQQSLLAERRLYINVKTSQHSGGELRGQLLPSGVEYFEAPLSGGQAIPTAPTLATGSVIVELNGLEVKIHGSFDNLGTAVKTSEQNGVHIHWTRFGDSGNTIRHVLTFVADDASVKSGVLRADDNTFTIDEFSRDLLRDRQWYADVHSLRWGLGELRGQVFPMSQLYFQGRMQDWNVIDPIDSGASVGILGELKDDTLTASGTFLPMMGAVTAAHIHNGFAWQNGPTVFSLNPTFITVAENHGFILPLQNRFELSSNQVQDLLNRKVYADIHTDAFPAGEVRATFVPMPNNAPTMPTMVSPADNELVENIPAVVPSFTLDWTNSTDPEGDPIAYLWQLSTGDVFNSSEMVYNVNVGNSSSYGVPGTVLDSVLAADGVAVGATKTYYHRALAFDGSVHHRTLFDQPLIRITRGTATGDPLSFQGGVFLEGAYSPGSGMSVSDQYDDALHTSASTQPFGGPEFAGTPLEYHGTETVGQMVQAVSWLLLSLHTDATLSSEIWRQAVLVRSNGTIIDGTGSSTIQLPYIPIPSLWVALRERNHLGVMSSSPVDFSSGLGKWYFRSNADKALTVDGPAMKVMSDGKLALFSGDVNTDGEVTAADFNLWLASTRAAETGYRQADLNFDGQVTATDFNLWLLNTKQGASEQIPD